jgi:hypothetical protein
LTAANTYYPGCFFTGGGTNPDQFDLFCATSYLNPLYQNTPGVARQSTLFSHSNDNTCVKIKTQENSISSSAGTMSLIGLILTSCGCGSSTCNVVSYQMTDPSNPVETVLTIYGSLNLYSTDFNLILANGYIAFAEESVCSQKMNVKTQIPFQKYPF